MIRIPLTQALDVVRGSTSERRSNTDAAVSLTGVPRPNFKRPLQMGDDIGDESLRFLPEVNSRADRSDPCQSPRNSRFSFGLGSCVRGQCPRAFTFVPLKR